jgi:hypothetical protein
MFSNNRGVGGGTSISTRGLILWIIIAMTLGYWLHEHLWHTTRTDRHYLQPAHLNHDDDNHDNNNGNSNNNDVTPTDTPATTKLKKANDPLRWSKIPQGFYDNEAYQIEDDATCLSTSGYDPSKWAVNYNKPWWLPKLVYGNNTECSNFKSMKKCHKSSLTCQWALQGYCFNYTAPNIGIFTNTPHALK